MSEGSSPLADMLRDWLVKLVPVILVWGITSEVRVQTLDSTVTRLETEFASRSKSTLRTQELVTKNTILLETQSKKIESLERDIRELVRILTRNNRNPVNR